MLLVKELELLLAKHHGSQIVCKWKNPLWRTREQRDTIDSCYLRLRNTWLSRSQVANSLRLSRGGRSSRLFQYLTSTSGIGVNCTFHGGWKCMHASSRAQTSRFINSSAISGNASEVSGWQHNSIEGGMIICFYYLHSVDCLFACIVSWEIP